MFLKSFVERAWGQKAGRRQAEDRQKACRRQKAEGRSGFFGGYLLVHFVCRFGDWVDFAVVNAAGPVSPGHRGTGAHASTSFR
ncbi:MAG: hypothetical protein EA364_16185 [Balneolaceae bacterium]|nr:MAG: hypothetical protein EA364_16185 [Balneolaceae bacterium]